MNIFENIINYLVPLDSKPNFKFIFENIYIDYKINQGDFLELINIYVTPARAVTTVEGLQSFMDNLLPSELESVLEDKVYEGPGQIVGRLYYDGLISDDYLIMYDLMTPEELAENKTNVELSLAKSPERRVIVTVLPNIEKAIEDLSKGVDHSRDFYEKVRE